MTEQAEFVPAEQAAAQQAEVEEAVEETAEQDRDAEPATYSAEYVRALREESAKYRNRAKRTEVANVRLAQALAAADGRLIDTRELPFTEELLDDDGLVDAQRVAAAIDALIADKPFLRSRTPTTTLPQGAQPEAGQPVGLFDLIRQRA